jgi:hypothetical protein
MSPDATGTDLLYVDETQSNVYVYAYPQGQLKGVIGGLSQPKGGCIDRVGDIFITNYAAQDILEYHHGHIKPIATFIDEHYYPTGCAVDPVTGDLAVANYTSSGSSPGNVAIYNHTGFKPAKYVSNRHLVTVYACAYDLAGNLYVDGRGGGFTYPPAFGVLRHGQKYLNTLILSPNVNAPGQLQWDGRYLVIGDNASDKIHRYSIKARAGTEVGSTALEGTGQAWAFWIQGSTVVGPVVRKPSVAFWKYPQGGSPFEKITGSYFPEYVFVSLAP